MFNFGAYSGLATMLMQAMREGPGNQNARARERRLATQAFDKDQCIEDHEDARCSFQQLEHVNARVGMVTVISTSTSEKDCPVVTVSSVPLSKLKTITLPELILGKRHYGRVLFGHFCVQAHKVTAVFTVLEDASGRAVRVLMYNVLSSTTSTREVELRFPVGMRVAIKEPFFKVCDDGKVAVRVDNPADICPENLSEENNSHPESSDAHAVEQLEVIRAEGNWLFREQNWAGAVNKYSQCITQAVLRKEKNGAKSKTNQDDLNRVVMLAYSNRAEARLRLQDYEHALADADKALEFDRKNVKTLFRKGKAAHGLGLFEKSCETFKVALEQSPQEHLILDNLKASTAAYWQSRNGDFDLTDFYSTGNVPFCADFVGPVQIRRVSYGCGRRGLFATRNVEAGKVLLVSNPLAISYSKSDRSRTSVNMQFKPSGKYKGHISTGSQQDLITEIIKRTTTSKRKTAQLYSLAFDNKEEMEIPSMELFRPGSEWLPPAADKLEVNVGLICEIARMNSFGFDQDNLIYHKKRLEDGDRAAKGNYHSGLWVLPSFANHSCAPNCVFMFVGDALFFRASREILEDEELTISYFGDLFENRLARQAKTQLWFFTCQCERCLLEETLEPQLSKISMCFNVFKHVLAAQMMGELRPDGLKRRVRELLALLTELEVVIHSQDINLKPKQQGWIRAAFLYAYRWEVQLAIDLDQDNPHFKISALQLILDSMTSISTCPAVVPCAAYLLQEVREKYFRRSQEYQLTEKRVLSICRTVFGKQPDKILHNLVSAYLLKFAYMFDGILV